MPVETEIEPRGTKLAWVLALVAALAALAMASLAHAQTYSNTNTGALVTLTAAGAGTTDSPDQTNYYGRGVVAGINISAKSGTIAVTVTIQGKDAASGQYYTVCQSASLTGTGFTALTAYPGIATTANVACSAPLPLTWRIEVVSGTGSTPSVTMTVGAALIL